VGPLVRMPGPTGPHKIEGVGIGYVPSPWPPTLLDDIVPVKTDDAPVSRPSLRDISASG
jgi:cysteine synthase